VCNNVLTDACGFGGAEKPLLISIDKGGALAAVLRSSTGDLDVTSRLAPGLLTMLGDASLVWAPASDTDSELRGQRIFMAAFSGDGTSVPAMLSAGPNGSVLNSVSPRVSARVAGPLPRVHFGAAVSSRDGSAFVVGGVDEVSGAPLGDAWRYRPTDGWQPLSVEGIALGRVLAAVARNADHAIYALDRTGQSLRLVRIPFGPTNAPASVVSTWHVSSSPDAVYLANSADTGRLVIVATSYKEHRYWGGTLVGGSTTPRVRSRFQGEGIVVAPPGVSKLGLSLAVFVAGQGSREVFLPTKRHHGDADEVGDDETGSMF
jgi:hypothetical protein